MKQLDKLAPIRNEIAHGHVSEINMSTDGIVVMEGNFLLPSLNEAGRHIRESRYAHTSTSIDEWRDKVRAQRVRVMDADTASALREQQANMAIGEKARETKMLAEAILKGHVQPDRAEIIIRPVGAHGI